MSWSHPHGLSSGRFWAVLSAALMLGCGISVVGGPSDVPALDSTIDAPDAPSIDVAPDDAPDVMRRCQGNEDCASDSAGPVCDRMTGRCGRCLSGADCIGNPAGASCLTATGLCGPCGGAMDCADSPAGPVCDATSGRCGRCTANADCAGNPVRPLCNTTTGQCFRCASNADCAGNAAGTLCNTLSGVCVRCTANIDCSGNPAGPACLMGGTCGRCTEDPDCMGNPAGPLCNRASGACTRCASNADCAGNPSGPQCNLLSGLCARCMSNNDCMADPAAPMCNAASGACFRCAANEDCAGNPAGLACNTTNGTCVACTVAADACPTRERCDPRTNTCVGGCRDDSGCASTPSASRCDPGTNTCVACAMDSHCAAGSFCRGNLCVAGCDATRPCPTSQTCCAGACVNTASNTGNCGACGTVCAASNATAACTAGRCAVGACNANFANCNASATDGCEVFTGGDLSNCGRCANACRVPPNAAPVCRGGVCGVGPCAGGFSDCNGMSADGCEANLQSSVTSCGACGRACPAPANAVATCAMARCGYSCLLGYADCDGDATNGCETDVRNSAMNCGACGTACRGATNASPSCLGGTCQLTCARGFGNCDFDFGNGCEVQLLSNVRSCGACGRVCPSGQECADGACTPPCPAGQSRCGSACVVLTNDPSNCGRCGVACSSSQLCGGGTCITTCVAPQTTCGRTCTTLATDPQNCGACGTTCRAGFGCVSGRCTVMCADSTYTACGGLCVNLTNDEVNCGGCGVTCRGDQNCVAGLCTTICAGRLSLCGDGECYDLANDPNNCGACGRVCSAGCYMGTCAGIAELESMSYNNCGLYTSGRVFCWGYSNGTLTTSAGGQTHRATPVQVTDSIGRPLEAVRQIATGDRACALLRNGTVRCWGGTVLGEVSSLTTIQNLNARGSNFCAVAMDGRVYCWNGAPRDSAQPALVAVAGITTAVEVAAGSNHACARLRDSTVVCWGTGNSGQLGDGRSVNSATPVVVSGLTDATALTAGAAHTCALRATGTVLCWGLNTNGQVGNGTTVNVATPAAISSLTGVRQVRAGLRHTCAVLTAGGVRCWGENLWSQLGDGTNTDRTAPVAVAGLPSSRWVSAYDHHSCAITTDNRVFCWGYNPMGEAGGGTEARTTPARVAGLSNVVDLQSGVSSNFAQGAGNSWRCALVCPSGAVGRTCPTGGTVQCWGSRTFGNDYGNLADGTVVQRAVPAAAMTLSNVRQISINYSLHGCAVRTTGEVACWGYNAYGQVGDGTLTNRTVPTTVPGLANVQEVRVGRNHTCAIVASGAERQVWCWGNNFHGELGIGTMIASRVPVRVAGITDASQLRMPYDATCIVRTGAPYTGQVWCWGRNIEYQLGDGSNTNRYLPGAVTTIASTATVPVSLTDVRELNCQVNGCWARLNAGTISSWGQNFGGTRATPTTTYSSFVDYRFSGNGGCAIRTDRTTACYGHNEFGNSGNGTVRYYDSTYRPVAGDFVALDIPYVYGNPCAIERGGTVACWGWSGNGGLLAAGLDGITRTPAEIGSP